MNHVNIKKVKENVYIVNSYSSVLQYTVKKAPVRRLVNSPKQPKKYVLIVSNRDEKLGLENPILIQKLMIEVYYKYFERPWGNKKRSFTGSMF